MERLHRHSHCRPISIHALREEGDAAPACTSCSPANFYPRPPRGGRPSALQKSAFCRVISIHSLREEGDDKEIDHA